MAQAVGQAPLAGLGQAHSMHRPLLSQDDVGGRVRQPVPQAQRPHRPLNRVSGLQQSTILPYLLAQMFAQEREGAVASCQS